MLGDAKPHSVWVVFVSYYQQHPASLFGHTLLLFPRGEIDGGALDLGSLAASFEGDITDLPATTYVPAGLFGSLKGQFLLEPFYVKSRKYTSVEQRDLWLFELPLSTQEIHRLLLHLWELRSATYDYGFLRANCSFQVLAALEAVLRGPDLTGRLRSIVSPAATLRVLEQQIGVRRTRFLPSPSSRLRHALARLSAADQGRLSSLIEGPGSAASKTPASTPLLDAALLYFEVNHPYSIFHRPGATAAERDHVTRHRDLLAERSLAGAETVAPPTLHSAPPSENPLFGHALSRLTLTFGRAAPYGNFLEAGIRGAIHDLGDSPAGFPSGLVLELARIDLRFALDARKVFLSQLAVVRVGALGAGSDLDIEVRPCWQLSLGADPIFLSDEQRTGALPTHVGLSADLGGAIGNRWIHAFSLIGIKAGTLLDEPNPLIPLLSLKAGLQFNPGERWTSTVQGNCVAMADRTFPARSGCGLNLNVSIDFSQMMSGVLAGSVTTERRDLALGVRHYW